jgi:hypothetical protein
MISLRRTVVGVCGLAVLSCLLACGGVTKRMQKAAQEAAEQTQSSLDLGLLGKSYVDYASSHKGKGPSGSGEWLRWAQGQKKDSMPTNLIQQTGSGGKYKFYWNVDIGKLPPGSSTSTVLGYESKVPDSGGVVVMADGWTVKPMSDTEFVAATKPPNVGN